MLFVGDDGGNQYLCTGTLINDSPIVQHAVPLHRGALHEVGDAAHTLNTFWFFDAVACNSSAVPPYVQLTGGAALLGRSQDNDWALVRLNETPPCRRVSAGVACGTGSARRRSRRRCIIPWAISRSAAGDTSASPCSTRGRPRAREFQRGDLDAAASPRADRAGGVADAMRVRRLLRGARRPLRGRSRSCRCARCRATTTRTWKDALPLMRAVPDAGRARIRPDRSWRSSSTTARSTTTSCRRIRWRSTTSTPACTSAGSARACASSPTPTRRRARIRCAASTARRPTATRTSTRRARTNARRRRPRTRSTGSTRARPCSTSSCPTRHGACPAGTQPLWRFFNKVTINHRYTAEIVIRDQMRAKPSVWIPEGYGPEQTIMCAAFVARRVSPLAQSGGVVGHGLHLRRRSFFARSLP